MFTPNSIKTTLRDITQKSMSIPHPLSIFNTCSYLAEQACTHERIKLEQVKLFTNFTECLQYSLVIFVIRYIFYKFISQHNASNLLPLCKNRTLISLFSSFCGLNLVAVIILKKFNVKTALKNKRQSPITLTGRL